MPWYALMTETPVSDSAGKDIEEHLTSVRAEYYRSGKSSWIIRSQKSSRELSEAVFPRDPDSKASLESHVVVRFDAYYGYHDRDLWEFVERKET